MNETGYLRDKSTIQCYVLRLVICLKHGFQQISSVRQRDVLSPALFSFFVNDLNVAKRLNKGAPGGHNKLSILFCADDIVLLIENENHLQEMVDIFTDYCRFSILSVQLHLLQQV